MRELESVSLCGQRGAEAAQEREGEHALTKEDLVPGPVGR